MTSRKLWGLILIFISAASFGVMPIFARLAYNQGVVPTSLLFLRFCIASVCMLMLMRLRGVKFPRGRVVLPLIGMGAIGYTGQSLSYFTALTMASAGLVSLLLYLYPVLVMLLSLVIECERITPLKVAVLALALVGSVLTIGKIGTGKPLGIGLGVLAACIYAVYIIVGGRVMRHVSALQSSTVIIASAAVMYSLIVTFQGFHAPQTGLGWVYVIAIAVISTAVAIGTFLFGVERVGATNASMLSTLEPAISIMLAVVILGETITWLQIVGGVLILAAVLLLSWEQLRRVQNIEHRA